MMQPKSLPPVQSVSVLVSIRRLVMLTTPVVAVVRGGVVGVVGGHVGGRSVVVWLFLVSGRIVPTWLMVGVLVAPGEGVLLLGRRSLGKVGAPQEVVAVRVGIPCF